MERQQSRNGIRIRRRERSTQRVAEAAEIHDPGDIRRVDRRGRRPIDKGGDGREIHGAQSLHQGERPDRQVVHGRLTQ